MKTKLRFIDGVRIEKKGNSLTFHVPTSMSGKSFEEWKERNEKAINDFKN